MQYNKYLVVLLAFIFSIYWIKKNNLIYQEKICIVIDAGSTGTRLHLYRLRSTNIQVNWKFEEESVDFVCPGLSNYASNVTGARVGIEKLLNNAASKLNSSENSIDVSIMFGATAGLRLVGEDIANQLLDEAAKAIISSPFKIYESGWPSVLSGDREGKLSWLGLAHLSKGLKPGTVDLGGGSTQITYWVSNSNGGELVCDSHLGLGLKSARLCILGGFCYPNNNLKDSNTFLSECLPHGYKGQFELHGKLYNIHSNLTPSDVLGEKCENSLNMRLANYSQDLKFSNTFTDIPFYIFGYFYDRIRDLNGTGIPVKLDQQVSVEDFHFWSKKACDKTTTKNPFQCLDLTYLHWLLKYGYQFSNQTPLFLMKEIDHIRIGWTVGAALEMVTT